MLLSACRRHLVGCSAFGPCHIQARLPECLFAVPAVSSLPEIFPEAFPASLTFISEQA